MKVQNNKTFGKKNKEEKAKISKPFRIWAEVLFCDWCYREILGSTQPEVLFSVNVLM